MKHTALIVGIALVGAATTGLLWSGARTAASDGPGERDLARGEAIYAESCASCHGADLAGEPDWQSPGPDGRMPAPPHDATGHTWHHPDRLLLDIMTRGTEAIVGGDYESNMPGFGDVYSEAELRDVLEWIKTHWPERERALQAEITANDEALR